jgi:long-chain fatty acid transport protein
MFNHLVFASRVQRIAAALLLSLASGHAYATNGYFAHGYGVKAQGIAGIGIALPQDALAAASNPGGIAFVDNEVDVGLSWFVPRRSTEFVGNGVPGANGQYSGNGTENFFIPEFGINYAVTPAVTLNLAAFGNGGMNTNYGTNPFAAFGSTGNAGVDLSQLFVAGSAAYKVNAQNSIGASVVFAYQRFKADGLGAFAPASSDPGALTNRGYDSSTGWGVRLGWTGKLTPELTLGLTWASKISASNFDKYAGLFADGGSFDIPSNYGVGIAFTPTPEWTLAADVQRILYGDVPAVANPLSNLFLGRPLGSSGGPGFGWRDITIVKVGASYAPSSDWTFRGGYSYSQQPIPSDQTFFNTLAPGVIQNHITLGLTWRNGNHGELSAAYTHGFQNTVNGSNSIPPSFGGGNANIRLEENLFGIAYAWKL